MSVIFVNNTGMLLSKYLKIIEILCIDTFLPFLFICLKIIW